MLLLTACLSLLRFSPCEAGAYMANEELSSISLMGRNASWIPDWKMALEIQHHIHETAILHLAKCPCVHVFGPDPEATPLSRLYIFDTTGEIASGLNHQLSNLRAVLAEGLGLGRVVLLRKPSLSTEHNFKRPFRYMMWGDFISFNESTFQLTRGRPRKSCRGRMSDCIADVSEAQLRDLVLAVPHISVTYYNGSVPSGVNLRPGLLVRGPQIAAATGQRDKVSLVRKLPGVSSLVATHRLRLMMVAPRHVLTQVPPVLEWLRQHSLTGRFAVVHARRGDKIRKRKYCPREMQQATSPKNIANVLQRAGVQKGSSLYIMSDEADPQHFTPLMSVYEYRVATRADFPHLRALWAGCSAPPVANSRRRQRDVVVSTHDHSYSVDAQLCENYLLYAIEKEILAAAPPRDRFVTIDRRGDIRHNQFTLMDDFLGPDKPCKSL